MPKIGVQLRRAREALGYTLEDVHEKTKIRPSIIHSLEADAIGDVPGGIVYAKGFVRILCDLYDIPVLDLEGELHVDVTPPSLAASSGKHRAVRWHWRRWLGLGIIVSALILAAVYYYYWQRVPVQPNEPPPVVNLPPVDPPPVITPEPPAPTLQAWVFRGREGNRDVYEVKQWPVDITVSVSTENCWFGVVADGQNFSFTLSAGMQRTFRPTDTFSVRLGNARVARIVVNGTALPQLTGSVLDIVLEKPRP